jgi:hypothetical protein
MRQSEAARRPHGTRHRTLAVLVCFLALAATAAAGLRAARAAAGPDVAAASAALTIPATPAPAAVLARDSSTTEHSDSSSARPFDHDRHEAIACTTCHGAGAQHRTSRVEGAAGCAACHHQSGGARTCASCHAPGTLPEPGTVQRELTFGVWSAARSRELPFGHELHTGVACQECHRTPVTLAMDRSCGSCHESHHTATANCDACHSTPLLPIHGAEVHLSCAGAGCHAPGVAPPPALSRALCIACHPQQRGHEADGSCASCHLLRVGGASP